MGARATGGWGAETVFPQNPAQSSPAFCSERGRLCTGGLSTARRITVMGECSLALDVHRRELRGSGLPKLAVMFVQLRHDLVSEIPHIESRSIAHYFRRSVLV